MATAALKVKFWREVKCEVDSAYGIAAKSPKDISGKNDSLENIFYGEDTVNGKEIQNNHSLVL